MSLITYYYNKLFEESGMQLSFILLEGILILYSLAYVIVTIKINYAIVKIHSCVSNEQRLR